MSYYVSIRTPVGSDRDSMEREIVLNSQTYSSWEHEAYENTSHIHFIVQGEVFKLVKETKQKDSYRIHNIAHKLAKVIVVRRKIPQLQIAFMAFCKISTFDHIYREKTVRNISVHSCPR